jgi:hypothetical protein
MKPDFEWDNDKDLANRKKHGVAFAEAVEVFGDSELRNHSGGLPYPSRPIRGRSDKNHQRSKS